MQSQSELIQQAIDRFINNGIAPPFYRHLLAEALQAVRGVTEDADERARLAGAREITRDRGCNAEVLAA